MKPRAPQPRRSSAGLGWWLGAAWLVLLFHAFSWKHARDIAPLAIPETPVDRVSPEFRRQWALLMDARDWIPPGADYTVRAETPDREMSLYMLSIGIFPHSHAIPSSYFGNPVAAAGDRAEYVIDESCRSAVTRPGRIVRRFRGGCVRRR